MLLRLWLCLLSLRCEMPSLKRIPESVWRQAADHHKRKVWNILRPGFVSSPSSPSYTEDIMEWKALDPKNPTYNFLIEYYGLKGLKGPRRLARWSPSLQVTNSDQNVANAVLLEGANEDDFGETLFLKGAALSSEGALYSPENLFSTSGGVDWEEKKPQQAVPFVWARNVLQNTANAEPVLHCFGLHEWAMLYQPPGAPAPISAKYQPHLPRRVSQETINRAVERKGVSCTHVDAMRFFATASHPFSQNGVFGADLKRKDQLRLEQPACVHAQMDLLKWSLKLRPFISADLVYEALVAAIEARKLDVAASPYDASVFGLEPIPVETESGRLTYRREQMRLMKDSMPTRMAILESYDAFIRVAFDDTKRVGTILSC